MHDLLIKNGTIIDGSGEQMFLGDIAVNDGVITEIGDLSGERGQKEVDATDKYVTPGFIDISNRSDVYWRLMRDPMMESLLWQGITTIIGGNSGSSLAPIYNQQMLLSIQKWVNIREINVNWESMKDFFDMIANKHLSVNFGTFVGHSTLRRGIVGDDMRPLSANERASMQRHIDEALQVGALGVSLGLVYTHGRSTTMEELAEIGTLLAKNNALLAAHLRDENDDLIDAVDEVLSVTEATNVRTHITHLKAVGTHNWPFFADALERVNQARAHGKNVSFDVYPYTYTGSVLYTFLPRWVAEGGKTMLLGRLRNKKIYDQVAKELEATDIHFDKAIVSLAPHAQALRGKTLGTIARKRGVRVSEVILDLLLASEGRVIILLDALSEENIIRALDNPYSIVTSNAPGYTITPETQNDVVHPRSFGSFPRLFKRYVREQKILSWELAVYKATGKVAAQLGLNDRGLIREGQRADIVVFDPFTIGDEATITDPMRYATGISWLFVNGVPTIVDSHVTGIRGGEVVRRDV